MQVSGSEVDVHCELKVSWRALSVNQGKMTEVAGEGEANCATCNVVVSDKTKAMACEGCGMWNHIKCIAMPQALYNAILKFNTEAGIHASGLHWYCKGCNVGVAKLRTEVQNVKLCQEKAEEELGKVRAEWDVWKKGEGIGCVKNEVEKILKDNGVVGVKSELEKLKKETGETKKQMAENRKNVEVAWKQALEKKEVDIKKSFEDIVKEEQEKSRAEREAGVRQGGERREIRMEVHEELEREKRKDKLVIMGVPEEGEDGGGTDIVKDVVSGLMNEVQVEFVVLGRIGKKGTAPNVSRPVRIRVEDGNHRRRLLAKAKELRNMEGMDKIYIVPDLTKMQQDADRKLREEVRNLRRAGEVGVRIVRGVIVKGREGDREDRSGVVRADEAAGN
jgi:hypothetical protein